MAENAGRMEASLGLENRQFRSKMRESMGDLDGLARAAARPRDEFGRFVKTGDQLSGSLARVAGASRHAGTSMWTSLARGEAAFNRVAVGAAGATVALTLFGGAATKVASEFEHVVVSAAALANQGRVSASVFGKLEESALQAAGATEFTARQVGEAMEFMAKAGQNPEQVMGNLRNVLQLATAATIDVGRAADITTNIMAGFGKTTSELAKTNDVLVSAFTGANVDLTQLGESFVKVGPAARGAGVSFEEATAALAALGNQGIQGGEAGRGLRRMLVGLQKPARGAAGVMKKLGLSTTDASKGFVHVVKKLEEARTKLRPEAFQAALFTVFDSFGGATAQALVGAGSEALEKMNKRLADSEGIAARIEKAKINTFAGQIKIVLSKLERVAIVVGKQLFPVLKQLAGVVNTVADYFSNLGAESQKAIVMLGVGVTVVTALAAALATAAGALGAMAALWPMIKAGALLAMLPLAKIVILVGALAISIGLARKAWEENWGMIREATAATWADIKTITHSGVKAVLVAFFTLIKGIGDLLDWVSGALVQVAALPLLAIAGWVDLIKLAALGLVKTVQSAFSSMFNAIAAVLRRFPDVAKVIGLDPDKVDAFANRMNKILGGEARRLEAHFEVGGAAGQVEDAVKNVQGLFALELQDPEKIADAVMAFPGELVDSLRGPISDLGGALVNGAHGLRGMAMESFEGWQLLLKDLLGPSVEKLVAPGDASGELGRPLGDGDGNFGLGGLTTGADETTKAMKGLEVSVLSLSDVISGRTGQFVQSMLELLGMEVAGLDKKAMTDDITGALVGLIEGGQLDFGKLGSAFGRLLGQTDSGTNALQSIFGSLAPATSLGGVSTEAAGMSGLASGLPGGLGSAGMMITSTGGTAAAGAGVGAAGGSIGGPVGALIGAAVIGIVASAASKLAGELVSAAQAIADGARAALDKVVELVPEERFKAAAGAGLDVAFALLGVAAAAAVAGAALIYFSPVILVVATNLAILAGLLVAVFWPVIGMAVALAMALTPVVAAFLFLGSALALLVGLVSFALNQERKKVMTENGEVEIGRNADRLGKGFEAVMDRLAVAIEPMLAPFISLVGLFDALISVVIPLAEAFGASEGVARVLFEVLKFVAVGLAVGVFAIALFADVLLQSAAAIATVFADIADNLFDPIAHLSKGLLTLAGLFFVMAAAAEALRGNGSMAESLKASGDAFIAAADNVTVGSSSAGNALRGVADSAQGMRPDLGAMGSAIGALTDLTFEEAVQRGNFLADLKETEEKTNESLLNVPSVFKKIQAMRFDSINADGGGAGAVVDNARSDGSTTQQPLVIIEGDLVIEGVTDEMSLVEKLERRRGRRAQRNTGNSTGGG